tara:strand:+ start:1497 stop:2711 length:1215 start_codon:yes stop_codon:yes gene_type:complete
MPKVFQICVEGNRGSTGIIAEGIGKTIISKGWDSYIAYGRFKRPSKSKTIRIGSKFSILFHGLITRLFDLHGFGSRIATLILVKKIKRIKPDIIHLHHIHGYYINFIVLFNFLKKERIPVVWTFHDCWSITGHCTHFDFVECDKWKTECFKCPQTQEYPKSFFIDRSKKNYYLKKRLFNSLDNLTIVCVSKWLEGVVSKSFLKKVPRKIILNGIDTSLFTPNHIKIEKNKFNGKFIILGVAANWNDRKGLSDFFKLSKLLSKSDIIILVGLTESQIRNLPKNIIGVSKTENQTELSDFYNISDVFLNLSVEETFGLTTAEALACGTPAIVYDSTASPELIDNKTGIIVKKGRIQDLLVAVNTVKNKGSSFYSESCRERAINLFNKDIRFMDYFKLYNNILSKNQ